MSDAYAYLTGILRILIPLLIICSCCRVRCRTEPEPPTQRTDIEQGQQLTPEEIEARQRQGAENRKKLLSNALIIKKVVSSSDEEDDSIPVKKGSDLILPKVTCPASPTADSNNTQKSNEPENGKEDVAESEEDVESGTTETINEEDDDDANNDAPTCSICLREYEPGQSICWSPNPKCTHFYHEECISSWLLTHDECPNCRNNFLEVLDEKKS